MFRPLLPTSRPGPQRTTSGLWEEAQGAGCSQEGQRKLIPAPRASGATAVTQREPGGRKAGVTADGTAHPSCWLWANCLNHTNTWPSGHTRSSPGSYGGCLPTPACFGDFSSW